MPIYEFQFGVYVQASDEQAARDSVREISKKLDEIDVEGDSTLNGPFNVRDTEIRDLLGKKRHSVNR